jgi:type II secretory pathway pseudopilin PulG
MNRIFLAAMLAVVTATGCASAQQQDGARAQMQQARDDAKTASLAALSADHRAKVQTVVDGFNAGTLDIPTASGKIDAILTPAESTAVLAQSQKLRDAMRAAFAAGGGPPGGGQGGGRHSGPGGANQQTAGHFLLSVGADHDKWRAAMQAQRANGAGGPP